MKDMTKHNGSYSRTRRSEILGNNPDPEPGTEGQIIASLSGGTRKPKAKEPEVYGRERHKRRGGLAQLIVYYRTVGWQNGHDEEKILYATSNLRDHPGTWITRYAEEQITATLDNWAGLRAELQRPFGVIDAKGEVRIRVKNMKQGKRSVVEYWNEFRLVASEAELDSSTGGELLQGGMITELQNAWGDSCDEYENLEALAQWATSAKCNNHSWYTKRGYGPPGPPGPP